MAFIIFVIKSSYVESKCLVVFGPASLWFILIDLFDICNLPPISFVQKLLLVLLVISPESCVQSRLAKFAGYLLQTGFVYDRITCKLRKGHIGA